MSPDTQEKINWTPVVITGLVVAGVFGGYLVIKSVTAGGAERRELAERILVDYQAEEIELRDWVEQIFAGGRTPTDEEMAVFDSMTEQMVLKEKTIYELSRTTFSALHEVLSEAASKWWLVPVGVASITLIPIAGYMVFKYVREWFNRRPPGPPTFECPVCHEMFYTKEALKKHKDIKHYVTKANLAQAQELFIEASVWVRGAVAAESGMYAKVERDWWELSLGELDNLAWAATTGACYGIAGVAGMTILRLLPALLLV